VTPLLEKVEKGLAHLRLGPVARHSCESVSVQADARRGAEAAAKGARLKTTKTTTTRVQMLLLVLMLALMLVQMRCFGEQSAGLWRVGFGFVETSTRVTQA
jgi:hypothetical protein